MQPCTPNFEPVHCSMSSSNCFLAHIQVSQGQVRWLGYCHLFKNCPQFVVIHTIKDFHVVNVAKGDIFLELPCFLYDTTNVGNLISVSSASLKPSWYTWKFLVHTLLKPSLKDFEHNLVSMWNEHNCMVVWTFFGIEILWDWNANWPFPVLLPLLSSPNLLTYWVQRFNSIIF